MHTEYHMQFMEEAIKEAQKAAALGEVPIGAVVVRDGQIVGRGYNLRERDNDPTAHAEILAMRDAGKNTGGWRLENCTLYVTMEPCPMCAGAIVQSRIENVYFGAYDYKYGCCGSKTNLFEPGLFYYNVNYVGGILETESRELIQSFFKELRKKKRSEKNEIQ